ncbi:uncharacterized protein UTRI_06450 [Ustilago trichophora]|uniref:Reverse transcriptase Ty1/copia-type domain-containing protein n=1 Tax=Ustilago trichophora TaxID=86804 RepID=A0A5C3EKC7_9BASI|nr:uncharacterized protein UTRI_06450 [Ustilago trichophora]
MGFKQLGQDVTVYSLGSIVMAVYVDDIIVVGPDADVDAIIELIKTSFKITGGYDAQWCLGVCIQQDRDSVILAQDAYADTILAQFSMDRAAEANTPLDMSAINLPYPSNRPLRKEQVMMYQQLVGSFMYLMTSTWPDLAFPVSKLASYLASPTTVHLNQARHLLRVPVTYLDAGSWKENPYSTSGFAIKLYGAAVAWRSRRQRVLNGVDIVAPGVPLSFSPKNQAAEHIVSTDGPGSNAKGAHEFLGSQSGSCRDG